jgi:O-acetyl-ADP-ribose deacetylase (regulator of RNase III)
VNTVNIVGVMGKGIALQFKELYPENYHIYKKACDNGELVIGKMLVTQTNKTTNPKYIINFPTKRHWRTPSEMSYIEDGLVDLKEVIRNNKIQSIAIPPLGAGSGGLDWSVVKKTIVESFKELNIEVNIFEPTSDKIVKRISRTMPKLTSARAFILSLLKQYTDLGFEPSLIETQKLAYFSQRFGENLKLRFAQDLYGPYAHNLTFLLESLDGYFIEGMRAKKARPFDKINIVDKNFNIVEEYTKSSLNSKQQERLANLRNFIQGFESPLGMELLSTVDYVFYRYPETKNDFKLLVKKIYEWNERKRRLMKEQYIQIAAERIGNYQKYLAS